MNIKVRLALMNFIELAVWGAYLTSMGNYLGKAGMGAEISWFYAIQGVVSIFMPTLIGIVADKYIQPQRLLGLCHLLAGVSMCGLFWMGQTAGQPDESLFMAVYTFSVAFYMPTLALSNTVAFTILKNNGLDTVKDFPPIRVFGTVGFIVMMWLVNCAAWDNGSLLFVLGDNNNKFQYTHFQFLVSGLMSLVLFLYCFTFPECKLVKKEKQSLSEAWGLDAFRLFKSKQMALFFIFSAMLGMSLQVTNGYATPFITSFKGDPAMINTFAANNATLLVSISQVAEALCILFVLSCIVYGVAFDFFNVSGGLFVDQKCDIKVRASAQGLFMLMTNGLGATIGTLLAGKIINHYCAFTPDGYLMGDWRTCWLIFAGYALVVGILFAILFKPKNL